jgi:outer membrane protein OmpA-like peptidoglycan-associated protein
MHPWQRLALALFLVAACTRPPTPTYFVAPRGTDTDADGAADIDDPCPEWAEDGLPPKANDGCPADDPDWDLILVQDDQCPDAKEDGAGDKPDDGCPSADADGDGVADARDDCPDKLEDNLGSAASDGCPDNDRDSDGIADARDRCPDKAESMNAYRDEDGCPDMAPGGAVVFDSDSAQIYIPEARRVDFETGSATLSAEGRKTVGEVAQVLKQHPEIGRLEIEGHASRKGSDAGNLNLTTRRSIAVAQALLALGVEANRLVPIGYGEYCPAVPEADGDDNPVNRRVLFKAVQIRGIWQEIPRGCWNAQTKGVDPTKKKGGIPKAPAPVSTVGGA